MKIKKYIYDQSNPCVEENFQILLGAYPTEKMYQAIRLKFKNA